MKRYCRPTRKEGIQAKKNKFSFRKSMLHPTLTLCEAIVLGVGGRTRICGSGLIGVGVLAALVGVEVLIGSIGPAVEDEAVDAAAAVVGVSTRDDPPFTSGDGEGLGAARGAGRGDGRGDGRGAGRALGVGRPVRRPAVGPVGRPARNCLSHDRATFISRPGERNVGVASARAAQIFPWQSSLSRRFVSHIT